MSIQISQQKYTLGLDIGIASVGAALLAEDKIINLFVRTFDKAEVAKTGESLNLTRREARLGRRRLRRRAHRLLRMRRFFKRIGLVSGSDYSDFNVIGFSPWDLRAEGLERCLAPNEWAMILYHIIKHRGFLSNRKSEVKGDEKAGKMLSGVSANKQRMQDKSYRTIGEMVAKDDIFKEAKRNKGGDYSHTFSRLDLQNELQQLFERQLALGNSFAQPEYFDFVNTILMQRRPTLSGANLLKMIGKCTFETLEYRAPKASYSAERFIWLGKLNNLKLIDKGQSYPLSDEERRLIIDLPYQQKQLTFKQVRKKLDLPDYIKFNLVNYRGGDSEKDPETTVFFEAKTFNAIKKSLSEAGLENEWLKLSSNPEQLNQLGYALTCFKDDKESKTWLSQTGFSEAVIDAVLVLSFDSFVALSLKALNKILPFMEKGLRYDEAALEAGYHHSQTQPVDVRGYLPAPDKSAIINPVVYRALNQARKLVNAIIKEYGSPMAVHIELARDLSKPYDERKKIEKEQEEFRKNRENLSVKFKELFGNEPNALDLLKFRFYEEQSGKCAYSLKPIDLHRLCEVGYVEVDHIIPYSRCYDDSMNNKALVLTVENRNKGNRTPYEYLGGANESEKWLQFQAFVLSSRYRQAKRNRLLRANITKEQSNEFLERNLNDTRYICREFKKMVETHLKFHDESQGKERCLVLAGQLTSLLRARWGLIKVRENGDLHHALDAAVIAAANRKMVQRMASYSKRKELAMVRESYFDPETGEIFNHQQLTQLEQHFPTPWDDFRTELLARLSPNPISAFPDSVQEIKPIRVSRAPTRRGFGSAHQDTIRSIGKNGSLLAEGFSCVKRAINTIKLKDLPNIIGFERDTALIDILRARLQAFNDNPEKAFQEPVYKPSKEGRTAPQIKSVKVKETQKSGIPIRGGIADNGNMLRVDIFQDKKKKGFYAVPLYVSDCIKTELPNKAVKGAIPENDWPMMDDNFEFLFSLFANDWLEITLRDKTIEGYFSGLDRFTASVKVWTHDRNQSVGEKGLLRGIGIKTALSLKKYHVDFLGNLYWVEKEMRKPLPKPKRQKQIISEDL